MKFSIRLGKGVDDQELEALLANPKIRKREELVFKIANDGRNPATAGIKGMQLELPADSQILESSITDKNPQSIQVDITTQNLTSGGRLLVVSFPPLKTGEFVTVKLSMSGAMPDVRNMKFLLEGDDHPHTINMESANPELVSAMLARQPAAEAQAVPGLTRFEASQLQQTTSPMSADSNLTSPIRQVERSMRIAYLAIAVLLAAMLLALIGLNTGLF